MSVGVIGWVGYECGCTCQWVGGSVCGGGGMSVCVGGCGRCGWRLYESMEVRIELV